MLNIYTITVKLWKILLSLYPHKFHPNQQTIVKGILSVICGAASFDRRALLHGEISFAIWTAWGKKTPSWPSGNLIILILAAHWQLLSFIYRNLHCQDTVRSGKDSRVGAITLAGSFLGSLLAFSEDPCGSSVRSFCLILLLQSSQMLSMWGLNFKLLIREVSPTTNWSPAPVCSSLAHILKTSVF